MAYYINDMEIVKNVDISYIISFLKERGEECVRIMYSQPSQHTLIIEPLKDKSKYVYQDGSRTVLINRQREICVNLYHSGESLLNHIINYKSESRDKKINQVINGFV